MDNNSGKVFTKPKTIYQQRINEIIVDEPTTAVIKDLIHLQLFKNAEKNEDMLRLVELYNLLGVEKFADVLNLFAGCTVKFPQKDDFRETVNIALCYYYKTFRQKTWNDMKEILEDDTLQTVKYGIKVQQLQRFMEYVGDMSAQRRKDMEV